MSELVANCPRCGSQRITFSISAAHHFQTDYGWRWWFEAFCICRHCIRATIFILRQQSSNDDEFVHKPGYLETAKGSVNNFMTIEGYISLKDVATVQPPEHLPDNVNAAFKEGATCLAVGCNNAAGTMFRLCIDLATRPMLPEGETPGLNAKTRRDLGLRLPWLFDNGQLPEGLRELSSCVKEDGNDGAHAGTLKKEDAQDLLDFTTALLERIYTEPERLRLAKTRRDARRGAPS